MAATGADKATFAVSNTEMQKAAEVHRVSQAMKDLQWYNRVLLCLPPDSTHPEIVKMGGKIGNKMKEIATTLYGQPPPGSKFTVPDVLAPDTAMDVSNACCAGCGVANDAVTLSACSCCKTTRYCSAACQKTDWPRHKSLCKMMKKGSPGITRDVPVAAGEAGGAGAKVDLGSITPEQVKDLPMSATQKAMLLEMIQRRGPAEPLSTTRQAVSVTLTVLQARGRAMAAQYSAKSIW